MAIPLGVAMRFIPVKENPGASGRQTSKPATNCTLP